MRVWRTLLIFAALSCICAAKAPPRAVDYTLIPVLDHGALQALDVTLRLHADPSGTTRLSLPDSHGGSPSLWKHVSDLHIDGARDVTAPSPAERIVTSAPNAPLTIRYRVNSAFDHDPKAEELDTYKPTIRPRWFWAYGEALFIYWDDENQTVHFRWNAPKDFPFASSLERPKGQAITLDDLLESASIGGPDLQILNRVAAGAPVRVAEIGHYSFTDEAFADMAARVIGGERRFWDAKEKPFLVALAPLTKALPSISVRGEGRRGAFSIMTTADAPLDFLKSTLGHEYFHTWNPARLGGLNEGDQERAGYWFSEGFTDFYARRLLLRMGVFSLEEFEAAWNKTLRDYAASPVRNEPDARIVKDFWNSRDVGQLPYQRGAILAARFDQALRTRSGGKISLDDVMRAMAARVVESGGKTPKAPDLFAETARAFGLDIAPEVSSVLLKGETAVLPEDAFGDCLRVRTLSIPTFDRGFDGEATARAKIITGVEPGSAAYAAGLRDGMAALDRLSGSSGDSRVPYTLKVRDGGAERVISYKPEGKGTTTVQEVQSPPDLPPERRAACIRAAAGGPPLT